MKAQSAIEFMMIFVLFLAALSVGLFISWQKTGEVASSTIDAKALETLNLVASKIDTVFLEGPGFSTNLTLPEAILGTNYSIITQPGAALLYLSGRSYFDTILPRNVTGTPHPGVNTLMNEGGVVVIS